MRNVLVSLPRRACLIVLPLGVGACSSGHQIDVTRRTSLPQTVKGAPFIVLLTKDEGSDPSYVAYAQTLVTQLQAHGLATVPDAGTARYAVLLERDWPHHGQADESAQSDAKNTRGAGEGGGMGGGIGGGMGGGMGRGGGGSGGFGHHHGSNMSSGAAGSRDTSLRIAIFDLTRPNKPDERVFFAKAQAPIAKDENDTAVNAMINAALKDFPGQARETYAVDLPRQAP